MGEITTAACQGESLWNGGLNVDKESERNKDTLVVNAGKLKPYGRYEEGFWSANEP